MSSEGVSALNVGGQSVQPGTKQVLRLPVTVGLNGGDINVWVHAVHGTKPGPTLVILSGLHGDEWFSLESIQRIIEEADPATLSGTLLVVPFANSPALGAGARNMPDETDSPDMNRIFPGPLKATSDQIIGVISRELLPSATHILDFHIGPWGSSFMDILFGGDFTQPGLSDENERLALTFGTPLVRRANVVSGFPGPRSSLGYGGVVLGIPALGVEIGGAGFGREAELVWHEHLFAGVRAFMGTIGMIEGAPDIRPKRQLVYSVAYRVNPSVGGILRPLFGPESLGEPVEQGTLLGTVVSPYTLEVIEELYAPVDGLLFYIGRDYPVNPGDWAFGIASTDPATSKWVENA
jgi:predicted deacylase